MHAAVIFVGPSGGGEEARDRQVEFYRVAAQMLQPIDEFAASLRQILGDVIEDLRAEMGRRAGPAGSLGGGFDGIADVLAVANADMAGQLALYGMDGRGIPTIGASLLAADIHLG